MGFTGSRQNHGKAVYHMVKVNKADHVIKAHGQGKQVKHMVKVNKLPGTTLSTPALNAKFTQIEALNNYFKNIKTSIDIRTQSQQIHA